MARRPRIAIPRNLVKEAWQLVMQNKKLYWLMIINILMSSVLIVGFFFDVIWPLLMASQPHTDVVMSIQIVVGVMILILVPFIGNLVNAAVIYFCYDRLNGHDTSLMAAFLNSLKAGPKIFSWTLLQILVGTILHIIDNGHERIAMFVIDVLIGVAWALLSFFVMPVMLLENKGVFVAIKESVEIVRGLWGKRAIVHLGVVALAFILLFALGVLVMYLSIAYAGIWTPFILSVSIIYLIAVTYTRRLIMTVIRLKLYMAVRSGEYTNAMI